MLIRHSRSSLIANLHSLLIGRKNTPCPRRYIVKLYTLIKTHQDPASAAHTRLSQARECIPGECEAAKAHRSSRSRGHHVRLEQQVFKGNDALQLCLLFDTFFSGK